MVKITGADKVSRKLRGAAGEQMIHEVGLALYAGGEVIRAEAHRLIGDGSASGQSGGKHQHVRSLPGEPPNRETGHLQEHIRVLQPEPLLVEVRSQASYAAALEYGSSKMLARPYMGPSARRKKDEAVALVRKAVSDVLRRT